MTTVQRIVRIKKNIIRIENKLNGSIPSKMTNKQLYGALRNNKRRLVDYTHKLTL